MLDSISVTAQTEMIVKIDDEIICDFPYISDHIVDIAQSCKVQVRNTNLELLTFSETMLIRVHRLPFCKQ